MYRRASFWMGMDNGQARAFPVAACPSPRFNGALEPRPIKITLGEAPEQNNVTFMARKRVAVALEEASGSTGGHLMRKKILSVLGATLLAASPQTAVTAAEHNRATTARAPVSASQQQTNQVAAPSPAEQNLEYWRARELGRGVASALR